MSNTRASNFDKQRPKSAGPGALRVLLQGAKLRAIGQTIATAGAFAFDHFVHVMDVLHLGMDGALGTDFTAQAAGDTESFDDFDFHHRFIDGKAGTIRSGNFPC